MNYLSIDSFSMIIALIILVKMEAILQNGMTRKVKVQARMILIGIVVIFLS